MIKLLINLFIKDKDNIKDYKVREKYTLLSGVLGIICNLFLFGVKLAAGLFMGSIAVISDAFNNFTDMGTSVVAIIGAKLSGQEADREHPYGHGRIEYVASLIISFIVILVGFELLKSSVGKIIKPSYVYVNLYAVIILTVTLFIKLWMFSYNRYIGRKIESKVITALSVDSVNDIYATAAVILVTLFGGFLPFNPDGYSGALVSLVIMLSGYKMAKETISTLLGAKPDEKTVREIEEILLENEEISGIHDLNLHDYGPGRIMGSVHAEVDESCKLITIHEVIDRTEAYIEEKLGVFIVIHIDPVETGSEKLNEVRDFLSRLLNSLDSELTFHDLRIVYRDNKANLLFDLCIPVDYKDYQKKEIVKKITDEIYGWDPNLNTVIKIDNKF